MADFVTDGKIGIDLTATYVSASASMAIPWPASPGDEVQTNNNGRYVFARANSTIAAFDCVVFSALADSASISATYGGIGAVPITTANCAPGATAGGGSIGIAQVAIASANWGWIAVNGNRLRVKTLVGCNPNVPLYTTSTAGSLDDTTVSAGYMTGITINGSATSASAPYCVASWPKVIILGAG